MVVPQAGPVEGRFLPEEMTLQLHPLVVALPFPHLELVAAFLRSLLQEEKDVGGSELGDEEVLEEQVLCPQWPNLRQGGQTLLRPW